MYHENYWYVQYSLWIIELNESGMLPGVATETHDYQSSVYRLASCSLLVITTMLTSSDGSTFRVTGHLWGGIHQSPVDSPHRGQWSGVLMFSFIHAWTNGWANNQDPGDLRSHGAHYDVSVMMVECGYGRCICWNIFLKWYLSEIAVLCEFIFCLTWFNQATNVRMSQATQLSPHV